MDRATLARWFAGRAARRWAVGAAAIGLAAVLWLTLDAPVSRWSFAHRVVVDYDRAKSVPVGSTIMAETTFFQRYLPLFGNPDAEATVRRAEQALTGLRTSELKFTTVSVADGQRRGVTALLLSPAEVGDQAVTVYLPSSLAKRGALLDAEAVLFANRLNPLRRMLVLPLPTFEQRGDMWPRLESLDLRAAVQLLRQTALDARRAVEACAEQDMDVGGLAGYSLGACLAAAVAGLHPRLFEGDTLTLFAGGGDLSMLAGMSEHPLARVLARPQGLGAGRYQVLLQSLDPLTWAPRAKVGSVRMVAGWRDEVVPIECTQALMSAYERTKIPCRLEMEEGGHPLTEGAVQMFGRLRERIEQEFSR